MKTPRGARTLACRVPTPVNARMFTEYLCSQECEHGTQECVRHKWVLFGFDPQVRSRRPPPPRLPAGIALAGDLFFFSRPGTEMLYISFILKKFSTASF